MKLKEIEERLNKINLKLIYKKNYNTKEKVDVIDNNGYKYYVSLGDILQRGFNSFIISKFNKPEYNLDNLKLYLNLNNIKLKVVGNPVITSTKDEVEFLCNCGNIFKAKIKTVIRTDKKHQCIECGISSRFKNRRHDFEYYKEKIEKYGLKLLDDYFEVKNNKQKFNVEDKDGYRYYVELSSIVNSDKLLKFYITNPHTIYNIKKYIKDNNIKTQLLSDTYKGSGELLTFKCECGEIYETSWNRFSKFPQHRCANCSGVKSNLEYLVERELINKNITYSYQYRINDCRDINVLPFDYAIFNNSNELICLIEVQGRQHYDIARHSLSETEEDLQQKLKITQLHDNIKDSYCKNNNIKLIKIPYWDIKNDKYKEIINTLIHNI